MAQKGQQELEKSGWTGAENYRQGERYQFWGWTGSVLEMNGIGIVRGPDHALLIGDTVAGAVLAPEHPEPNPEHPEPNPENPEPNARHRTPVTERIEPEGRRSMECAEA